LSCENGKDIKVVLNFSKFLVTLIAKICILQAIVPILAISLGNKIKEKMQILVIFDFHFKDVIFIIFCVGFGASLKSGNDFLYLTTL
jgi:hypothetical protein